MGIETVVGAGDGASEAKHHCAFCCDHTYRQNANKNEIGYSHAPAQDKREQGRPQQIKLLFDRERPGLAEESHRLEVSKRLLPIGRIESCEEDGGVPVGVAVRRENRDRDRVNKKNKAERGKQAEPSSHVERAKTNATSSTRLFKKQGRDQESTEDKKNVDADEAASRGSRPMPPQDSQDCQSPKPVQLGTPPKSKW